VPRRQFYKALKSEVVQAEVACFLASIREGIEDDYKGKTMPEQGESAAARALRMFSPTRSAEFRARRTTVTEEVKVKGGET